MSLGGRWCETAPPLELAVPCGGAVHRLAWDRGVVSMLDHPEGDAELALVALGGEPPACLELATLYEAAVADGGFLEEWVDEGHLSPARLSWLGMALERLRSEGFHEFLRSLPPARAASMGRFLRRFPRPWLDRAAATVAEAVIEGEGVTCLQARPLIEVAVSHRLRRAFVTSVGSGQLSVGAAALVPLRVLVTGPTPRIEGGLRGPSRGVSIAVDRSWLHRVWAAGAAVVDGQLVLDLELDRPRYTASRPASSVAGLAWMVSWPDDRPMVARRRITHDGLAWSLAPTPAGT